MGDKIIEKKKHVPSQEYPLFHREKEKKIELDHEKMIEKVDLHKEQLLEKTRAFFDQELRVFQNKIEIEEDLATLGEQVNENKRVSDLALNIFDHQEKTVDQIDHELMSAFGIVVGRELVGSLHKELIKKFQHPLTGKIDKQAYLHQKKDYATNTPTLLKSSLDRIWASLTPQQEQYLVLIQWNSIFAKSFEQHYKSIAQQVDMLIPEFIDQYNNSHDQWLRDIAKQKFSSWVNYTWDGVRKVFSKEWRQKDPLQTSVGAAALVGWGYLGYKAIRGVIDRLSDDQQDDDDKSSSNKKKKKSDDWSSWFDKFFDLLGNWLKWWVPLAGGAILLDYWLTGNFFFQKKEWAKSSWDVLNKKTISAFSEELPEIQQTYNAIGDSVNQYYQNSGLNDYILGDADYEKKDGISYPWTIPYLLSNKYKTVGHMLSEKSLFLEKTDFSLSHCTQTIKTWSADQIKTLLWPVFSHVSWFSYGLIDGEGWMDRLVAWIEWSPEAQKYLQDYFRKINKIKAYLLSWQEKCKNKSDFSSSFIEKNLYDAFERLKKQPEFTEKHEHINLKKVVEEVDEQKKEFLDEDSAGHTTFDRMREGFENGLLTPQAAKEFDQKTQEILTHIEQKTARRWYHYIFGRLPELLNIGDANMFDLIESSGYTELIGGYVSVINELIKKKEQWTLTKEDINTFEDTVNQYFTTIINLFDDNNTVCDIKENEWNMIVTIGTRLANYGINTGKDITHGVTLMLKGEMKDGILITLPWTLQILGVGTKTWRKILSYPIVGGIRLTQNLMRPSFVSYTPDLLLWSLWLYKNLSGAFLYDLFDGSLDLKKAAEYARQKRWMYETNVITEPWELLSYALNCTKEEAQLIEKYRSHPVVRKWLIDKKFNTKNIFYQWFNKKQSINFYLNTETLDAIKSIDVMKKWASQQYQIFIDSLLQSAKHPDLLNALSQWKYQSLMKYCQQWADYLMTPEKLAQSLAKYQGSLDHLDEVFVFLKQAKKIWKIQAWQEAIALVNTLRHRNTLSTMNQSQRLAQVETLSLSASRYEQVAQSFSRHIDWLTKKLSRLLNSPRIPQSMRWGVQHIHQIIQTFQQSWLNWSTIQAAKNINTMWSIDDILASGQQLLTIKNLINHDKTFVELLKKASNVNDVKQLLTTYNIDTSVLKDSVIKKLSTLKDANSLKSYVTYIEEAPRLNTIQKLLKNPATRKVTWRLLVFMDMGFVARDYFSDQAEIEQLKKINQKRSAVKSQEQMFDLMVWSIWASAALAALLIGSNPVWWVVGWIWAVSLAVKEVWDRYYDVVHEHYKNVIEYQQQTVAQTKQAIISLNSYGSSDIDQAFWSHIKKQIDKRTDSTTKESEQTSMSIMDAIVSLLITEETAKFPLSAIDLNSPEVVADKQFADQIREQKKQRDHMVQLRKQFFDQQQKKSDKIIDIKDIKDGKGIQQLDVLLHNSLIYAQAKIQWFEGGYESYLAYEEKKLREKNSEYFLRCEKIFTHYPRSGYYVAWLADTYEWFTQEYASWVAWVDHELLDYWKKFAAYWSLKYWYQPYKPDIPYDEDGNIDVTRVDFTLIEHIMRDGKVISSSFEESSLEQLHDELWKHSKRAEKLYISSLVWQNILFDIAQRCFHYQWTNTLAELQSFFVEKDKDYHGIYWDQEKKQWAVNDSSINDFDDYLIWWNDLLWLRQFSDALLVAIQKSAQDNDMLVSHNAQKVLNKEYGNMMIDIIKEHQWYLDHHQQTKKRLEEYITTYSQGKYIAIPDDLCVAWMRAGIQHIDTHLFAYQHGKIVSYPKWVSL